MILETLTIAAWLAVPRAAPSPARPVEGAVPALRALLDKHVEWLGGREALSRFDTLRLRGEMEAAGLRGTVTVALRRDGYSRADYDLGPVREAECVTPEGGWKLNASGQVEDLGRNAAEERRRALARAFGEHLLADGVAVEHLAREEKGGRWWEVVRFAYPQGDAWDLFLDPSDGSSQWAREVSDTETTWHHDSDWRKVAGVRIPFRGEQAGDDPAERVSVVWTEVEAAPDLPTSAFARPAERKVARIAGGAAATEWMPIVSDDGRSIRLMGTVNDREADILLDSGAGITVLARSLARELELDPEGSLIAQGTAASAEAALVRGVSIRIGGVEVADLTAAVIDLSEINRGIPRPLEVILGKELFHSLVVDMDYPSSRVRFHDPGRFTYRGPGRRLAIFPAQDGHKLVEVRVEDLPPALVGLDTGSGATLDIFRYYADEHGLLEGRSPVSETLTAGVGGTSVSKVATLRSLSLAGYTLREVPVGFYRGESGSFHTRRLAGNLGAGILSRFRILFDYARGALWVEPGEDWDRPFEKNRTGLLLLPDEGALRVLFVAPGSPAAAAGWREGERVVAVDGKAIDASDPEATAWTRGAAGTRVRLETEQGAERELVLADYY